MLKKCKNRKKGILAAAAAVMASLFLFSTAALASDQAVVFTEDPADAEKGKVCIGAIVEKGFKGEVTVELYPEFVDGSIHKYTLSKENNYLLSDDIMTGSYEAVAYLSGEGRKNSETATYGGEALKVRPGSEDAPYFAAVAGSSDFVEEYGWLSAYATGKGTELCGPVTWDEARAFFEDAVAHQGRKEYEPETNEPEDDTHIWEPEIDITENSPGVNTDSGEGKTSGDDQNANSEPEHPDEKTGGWKIPAAVAAVCILAGCGFFVWRRKK